MCLFCNNPQTLGHVVASCVTSLNEKRYNFRHDSVLLNIVRCIQDIQRLNIYADIAGFKNPTLISGEDDRPDIIIHDSNQLYVLELTVGYETNMSKNSNRKQTRYENLIKRLTSVYKVTFINLSMGALGIFGKSSSNYLSMLKQLGKTEKEIKFIMSKLCNVCIRSTYYIFCLRNKSWESPDLISW